MEKPPFKPSKSRTVSPFVKIRGNDQIFQEEESLVSLQDSGSLATKLVSWNIDSLNAALISGSTHAVMSHAVTDTSVTENADIITIQETKLSAKGPTKKCLQILQDYFPEYEVSWCSLVEPARKGYAGTVSLYKSSLTPSISYPEIGAPDTMDSEGRIITLEFDRFFVTQVYTPNAGDGLKRLAERQIWNERCADYLAELDQVKPALATGDYDVAHREADLAHPSSDRRSPGFTDEERAGSTNLLAKGFTDAFRYIHGDIPDVYNWWAQRSKTSKINNSGWRIDYWLTSSRIADKTTKSEMIDSGARRDHVPIVLETDL